MWKELEGNYYLFSAFLCLWTLLDEFNHYCNSETREDSLRGYPECEGIHGRRRMSRLRIRFSIPHSTSTTLQLRKRLQKQLRTLENLESNLGRVLEKLRREPRWGDLGGPYLSRRPTSKQSVLEALLVPLTFILALYVHIFASILRICSSQGRFQYFSTSTSHITVVTMFCGPAMTMYMRPGSWYDSREGQEADALPMLSLPSSTPSSTVRRIM